MNTRTTLTITKICILAGFAFPHPAVADNWLSLIDTATGTTNGPFRMVDGGSVTLGTNRYRVAAASPIADLDRITVSKFEARHEAVADTLRRAWQSVPAGATSCLPELVFFGLNTNKEVTLSVRQLPLSDLLRYVCEIADTRMSRRRSRFAYQPRDVLIVQPDEMQDDYETQVYYMQPGLFDAVTANGRSLNAFLREMGVIRKESDAVIEHIPEKRGFILRAPREAHEILHRCH